MKARKVITLLITAAMGVAALAGCGGDSGGGTTGGTTGGGTGGGTSNGAAGGESVDINATDWSKADPITIDVFSATANFMGIQSGWFGKVVEEKFNMKLNIIAPNVAGGGDTLYNTRAAGGNVGDLIIMQVGQQLNELVAGGLLMDASAYYPSMENVRKYDAAVQYINEGKNGIYGFPTEVSELSPTSPSEGLDSTFGAFGRWDYYAELGYPKIASLEDLLPVLKDMQTAHPTTPDGKKVYGISLFPDWDGNMMVMAKQPTTLYGYDEMGFVLARADGSDFQSIIDSNSEYVRALHFYFEANQMGLLDPESPTQNYDTLFAKYQGGQVLLAWWPWLAQSAFNTVEREDAGEGFMLLPIEDQKVFSYGVSVYGAKAFIGIGSKAPDPARIAAFIDWLYSPDGITNSASETMGAAGPLGLTWDIVDGKPELTDFGKEAILGGGADVPADWGGGAYMDGVSALNVSTVLPIDIDPRTGIQYDYRFWPSVQAIQSNPLRDDWSAHMGGATGTMDYLERNNQVMVAPGASFVTPEDSSEIMTLRNQIKAVIIEYSWKMVMASDQAQFDSLLAEMQSTANGLGYDKVLEVDMANAKAQNDLRVKVAAEHG